MERDFSFSEEDRSPNDIWNYVANCRHETRDNNEEVRQILNSGSPELPPHLFETQTPPNFRSSPELDSPYFGSQKGVQLLSSSSEPPPHLFETQTPPTLEKTHSWSPQASSNNNLPLENRTLGIQREGISSNFHSREDSSAFPSSEFFSDTLGCSTPKKVIDRSRLATSKNPFLFPANFSVFNSSETQTMFSSKYEEFQSNLVEYLDQVASRPHSSDGRLSVNSTRTDPMGDPAPDIPIQSKIHPPYTMPYHEVKLVNSLITDCRAHPELIKEQARSYQEKLSKSEDTISNLKQSLQHEYSDNESLTIENANIKKQLQAQEAELQSNRLELKQAHIDQLELEKRNQELVSLLDKETEKSTLTSQKLSNQQSDTNLELDALREENRQLDEENAHLAELYQALEEERGLLLSDNANLVASNKHFTAMFEELQEHLNSLDILQAVTDIQQEMVQLRKDQEFLEKENRDLIDQVEALTEQNKNHVQNIVGESSYQETLDKVTKLDKDVEELTNRHENLQQQKRTLDGKLKTLETSVNKKKVSHEQLFSQSTILDDKITELKEKNKLSQETISKLMATKNELVKKRRSLEMDIGNLEVNISNFTKSLGRAQPTRRRSQIPNFTTSPTTQPNSRTSSRGSSRPQSSQSNLISKSHHQSHGSEGSLGIDDPSSFNITIPNLSFIERDVPGPTPKEINLITTKLEKSRTRIAELEATVLALRNTVDTFTKAVESKSIPGSVEQSPIRLQTPTIHGQDVSQVVKTTHDALEKFDDLCKLLQSNTGEFDRLIQAEDRVYRLKEQNDQLQSDLEAVTLELNRIKDTSGLAGLDPELDKELSLKLESDTMNILRENHILRQQLEKALETPREYSNQPMAHLQSTGGSFYDAQLDRMERTLESSREKQQELMFQNQELNQYSEECKILLDEANKDNFFLRQEIDTLHTDLENIQFVYDQVRSKLHQEQSYKKKYIQELQSLDTQHRSLQKQHEQLVLQRGSYPTPKSTSSSHSRSNSTVHDFSHHLDPLPKSWDEINKIFNHIKVGHHNQRYLFQDLQDGLRLDVFQSRFMDSIIELKELDLQIQHLLNRGANVSRSNSRLSLHTLGDYTPSRSHSRSSSVVELQTNGLPTNRDGSTGSELGGHFVYTKPYKEMCAKYRAEALQLRARVGRETNFRADLVFQKRYLLMVIGGLEAGEDYTLSFISSMGVGLPHGKPTLSHGSPLTVVANSFLSPAVRRTIPNTTAATSLNRCRLRRCVWVIVALVRAQASATMWRLSCEKHLQKLPLATGRDYTQ